MKAMFLLICVALLSPPAFGAKETGKETTSITSTTSTSLVAETKKKHKKKHKKKRKKGSKKGIKKENSSESKPENKPESSFESDTESKSESSFESGSELTPESSTSEEVGTGGTSTYNTHRYPVAEIDRPFALLPMILEPEAKLILDFYSSQGGANWIGIGTGAGFGILKNLEAGLTFPLRIDPETNFGDFDFYGLYDLTSMLGLPVNLAGRFDMIIPASDYSNFGSSAQLILLASGHLKYKLVSSLAALADISIGAGFFSGDDAFLFFFDYGILYQVMPPLALTMTSGFHVFAGNQTTSVPLRLRGQYTVGDNLDVFIEMAFPDLKHWKADYFQLIGGAAFRIGL